MSVFRKLRLGGVDPEHHRIGDDEATTPKEDLQGLDDKRHAIPHKPYSERSDATYINQASTQDSSATSEGTIVALASSSQPSLSPNAQNVHGSDDPLGLSLIHGNSESEADIIFVHGLGGSSRRTWSWERQPENFWPAWLRHEDGLSHFRVFSYGYNANFRESKTPLSILDFSKGLLVHMKTYAGGKGTADHIGLKPMFFVAHSMGGLVVKKALIIGRNDDIYSMMLSNVHGIMFLSTPHKGSQYARTLNNFLSILMGAAKVYVSELDSASTSIEDISEQFRGICGPWKLASLYETLPTKFMSGIRRMIVGKDSGILNYPHEITAPVDADHHTIAKFSGRMDSNYVLVTNLLKQLTCDITLRERPKLRLEDSRYDSSGHILERMFGFQGQLHDSLEAHLNQAHQGSCQWLLRSKSFNEWHKEPSDTNKILWLTGLPGTGKSTLAATTIDHIQRSSGCQFHFLTESHPMKRSADYCLRAIAYQLASQYPQFLERLLRLHQDTGFTGVSQSFQVIWETIFENIIFQMSFDSPIYWVIDGLDEADSPALLARHMTQIESRSSIRLLLLSRPKRELTSLAGSSSNSVIIQPILIKHTMADIQSFISSATSEILPQDRELQALVVAQMANRAEGSFLWTKLALDSLWDNWHTKADIDTALERVPQDMKALYERMVANIRNQPSRHQDIAVRVLTWASCAYRPLTVTELLSALRPEFDGFVNLRETVVQICGQFVRIDQDVVTLIHSTARQFLLHPVDGRPAFIGLHVGHDHLARICLQYLCHDSWRQILARVSETRLSAIHDRLESLYKEYTLLNYAMSHWAYHVRHASADSPELLLNLRLFCNKYIMQWIQAVALSSNMAAIPQAARYLKKWLRERRKRASLGVATEDSMFLEDWANDLIRVVGKFGMNMLQSPSAIHRHIPPFCPKTAAIARRYNTQDHHLISVRGLSAASWDDNLARLSLGQDDMASAIRCGIIYFFTLISHSGTVIVWHMETCEELRRICHDEWVMRMEINKSGSLVATAGRHTYRVWDSATGHQLYTFDKYPDARTISLDFANTDSQILVGYDDCSVVRHTLGSSERSLIFQAPGQDTGLGNCARFMALSPDHTKAAIAFRGRPVVIWDLDAGPQQTPRSVVRFADKDLLEDGNDVYNSPEIVRWSPDSSMVYILYQDAAILVWDLIDDTQAEFDQTEAREMSLNKEGTLLLTSSNDGSISVWALQVPRFNLVYRLHSDGFVRDLAFGSDGQRIYDIRGTGCNVWAPDALVRPDEPEQDEVSSSCDGSYLSEVPSEPVFAEDHIGKGRVTALACDSDDEFFCCGRDDGSVTIHDMVNGEKVRKVCNHSTTVDIVSLEWSSSRRLIASADDSGKVIVKKLRVKQDGKWAVYPVVDFRVGEAISQMLFSSDEAYLLVSTESTDHLWSIQSKTELSRNKETGPTRRWLNRSGDGSHLIQVTPSVVTLHNWADLSAVVTDENKATAKEAPSRSENFPSSLRVDLPELTEKLRTMIQSHNQNYLIYEIEQDKSVSRRISGARIDMLDLRHLETEGGETLRRKTVTELSSESRHLLGVFRDRVVFLDHKNWICTCSISWEMGSRKRHFFLPRDWANDTASQVLSLNRHGTLLCSRNGEVAILRYLKGF